jgi:hypothetical protein
MFKFHYSNFPALKSYIDRIGAEPKNFRRYIVPDPGGGRYKRELAIVTLKADLTIACSNPLFAPSEEEQIKIMAELASAVFPKSVEATLSQVEDLRTSGKIIGELFVIPSLDERKNVIMCHERREKKDNGSTYYVPWTKYAEGQEWEWLSMEPDGAIPFWKPLEKRQKGSIMVHEGAKAAAFIDGLLNDITRRDEKKAHPFADELEGYEHWGIIGGAYAVARADFSELLRAQIPGRVVYSADNDAPGEEAASTFSRHYRKELEVILYGADFPLSWDLADKIPAALYNEYNTVERKLMDMARPATWATRVVTRGERVSYVLSKAFAEEWVHTIKPELFINRNKPRIMFTEKKFENYYSPFSDTPSIARLIKTHLRGQVETIKYDPGRKTDAFSSADGTFFNIHRAPNLQPYLKKPDYAPFEHYLSMLIQRELELLEMKRWLATLIARPGVKMRYGGLLISETQGVGKSTLGKILKGTLGWWNVCFPPESDITNSDFTYWQEHRLAVINEIYAGHSSVAYNKLKDLITEPTLHIKKKYLDPYDIDNHLHVLAFSNSFKALKLDDKDRRWFVPEVTEELREFGYWTKFNAWLDRDEGYRKIKYWAEKFLENHKPVSPEEFAPRTATRQKVIEATDSPGMSAWRNTCHWIRDAYRTFELRELTEEELTEMNEACGPTMMNVIKCARAKRPIVGLDTDAQKGLISSVYEGRRPDKLESENTLRKIASGCGLFVGPDRIKSKAWHNAYRAYVISNSREVANADRVALARDTKSGKVEFIELTQLVGELHGSL